jgi:replication-associated recombination protein RarA
LKKELDKLKKDFIFALGLDDEVPEHIAREIFGEEIVNNLKNKDKNVQNELESLTVQEFNEEVRQKLGSKNLDDAEVFFDEVIGYSDIKRLLLRCIQAPEPIHVILDGPPASAKSMFLLQANAKLENTYYMDCTNATGPGIVDVLFENDVKYLFLDEVEKMSDRDQNVLLNVMETGILTSTKVRHTGNKEMSLSIYATTNDIDAISKPFRSRFMEFSLPAYTYEEFQDIAVKLLAKRYGHEEQLSLKIADTVWNKIKSKDVRDMLQIGKLSKTVDDVDFIAETLHKYRRKPQ